jgi:predicted acetyltransferase
MMPSMPPVTPELVNPVPVEEVPGWARAMASTFLGDPAGPATARRIDILSRRWEPERAWGVRDGKGWVATLRTEERGMTVPGFDVETEDVAIDALTNVTVAATHRRRGLMARMLTDSLRAARERGDPLSALIAAEWPIYGRFGYAPATRSADYVLRRSRAGSSCPGDPARAIRIERDEVGEVAGAVFAAARRHRAGQIDRPTLWWDRVLGRDGYPPSDGLPHNWLAHQGENGADGLLGWKASGEFGLIPPLARAEVWDLACAGDTAYRNLWAYLSGLDGIDEVSVPNRPVDEPVRWLLADGRTLVTTQLVDFLWLRLLDVPAALAARRYAAPGEVVLEVVDEDGERFAAGRYRLRAHDDEVECERTDRDPDLALTQRALASIYLGGFRLRELVLGGGATELRPGALALVDVMFSTPLAPWNATWF